jgi:hypothetical protein
MGGHEDIRQSELLLFKQEGEPTSKHTTNNIVVPLFGHLKQRICLLNWTIFSTSRSCSEKTQFTSQTTRKSSGTLYWPSKLGLALTSSRCAQLGLPMEFSTRLSIRSFLSLKISEKKFWLQNSLCITRLVQGPSRLFYPSLWFAHGNLDLGCLCLSRGSAND